MMLVLFSSPSNAQYNRVLESINGGRGDDASTEEDRSKFLESLVSHSTNCDESMKVIVDVIEEFVFPVDWASSIKNTLFDKYEEDCQPVGRLMVRVHVDGIRITDRYVARDGEEKTIDGESTTYNFQMSQKDLYFLEFELLKVNSRYGLDPMNYFHASSFRETLDIDTAYSILEYENIINEVISPHIAETRRLRRELSRQHWAEVEERSREERRRQEEKRRRQEKSRMSRDDREREALSFIFEGLANAARENGSFTLCNGTQSAVTYVKISTIVKRSPSTVVKGFFTLDPNGCHLVHGNIDDRTVVGISVLDRLAGGWSSLDFENLSSGNTFHTFDHICFPESGPFRRVYSGSLERNPCRSDDNEVSVSFIVQANSSELTLTLN